MVKLFDREMNIELLRALTSHRSVGRLPNNVSFSQSFCIVEFKQKILDVAC